MNFNAPQRVLVLSAHPDDAELSVGGTIAWLTHRGVEVTVANFTTSEYTPTGAIRRRQAAAEAAEILGHRLHWVDDGCHNQVEDIPEYRVVGLVDALVSQIQPDVVLSPWQGDSHGDHVRLARATLASSRRWECDLYAYSPGEVRTPSSHAFCPSVFVDITPYYEKKIAAIKCYSYEGQGFRPLDMNALTTRLRYYGTQSGFSFAEGLMLLRQRCAPLA